MRLLALAQAPLGRQAAVKAAAGGRDVAAEEQTLNVADTQEQVLAGALADESLWYALILFFIGGCWARIYAVCVADGADSVQHHRR